MTNSRSVALEEYRKARRLGEKYYHACVSHGDYPYPRVLEEVLGSSMDSGIRLGLMEIPTERIIGTRAAGRKKAFAGNFMPLLGEQTEFGSKWIALCEAHMSDEGIHDPITAIEFMGMFYVQEGHKRVSVMRYFGNPSIPAEVTRILPAWSEDTEVRVYYEFLDFWNKSQVYQLSFHRLGDYARLQKALGFEPDHVWTEEERVNFLSLFWHFRDACDGKVTQENTSLTPSEAILACLEIYPYEELVKLDKAELIRHINAIMPDLRYRALDKPSAVSTQPEAAPEKHMIGRLLDGIARPVLHVAFVHASDPETSSWSRGHDLGRSQLEQHLGSRITVKSYVAGHHDDAEVMEQAVQDGAQMIFATAPTLLAAARKTAALHPAVKVLVCALSVPYAGIRTYYARIYEARFINGALAGALSGGQPVGYVARYPILGTPAAINAFALGVRMTAPDSDVHLEWSSLPGDPIERLRDAGVRIVSGPELAVQEDENGLGWSTFMLMKHGDVRPIASALWDWGKLYEQLVSNVLDGCWDAYDATHSNAVNYWWGMNSGVIDVRLADDLPAGIVQLTDILKRGLIDGSIQPFLCKLVDQQGHLRNEGDRWLPPEEIMRMNWLCENVVGRIPDVDELVPMSRETTELLSLK